MAILDQNSSVAKYHFVTDNDVKMAKEKLDNQKVKKINDELER